MLHSKIDYVGFNEDECSLWELGLASLTPIVGKCNRKGIIIGNSASVNRDIDLSSYDWCINLSSYFHVLGGRNPKQNFEHQSKFAFVPFSRSRILIRISDPAVMLDALLLHEPGSTRGKIFYQFIKLLCRSGMLWPLKQRRLEIYCRKISSHYRHRITFTLLRGN